MRNRQTVLSAVLILAAFAAAGADWPQFRGSESSSIADATPPLEFDVASGKNVAWSTPLPGRGASSPIVVAGRVYVTASSGANQDRLHVLCFDSADGKQLWERQFWATGRTLCHPTSSIAAPTPASDGQRIFAFYSSNDLVCLDLDGNLQWYRGLTYDHPTAANDVGMASSPLVVGPLVIVQVECLGDSFAAAIDTTTGETRWRIDRPKVMNWCSPVLLHGKQPGADLILLQGPDGISAHDPKTGRAVWSIDRKCNGIPSPVVHDEVIYLASEGLTALGKRSTAGDPEILWATKQLDPASSSPVVQDGSVYVLNRAGALTCGDADTGEVKWRLRLKGSFWATPVVAGNYLFAANSDGEIITVKLGDQGEIVATSALGEPVYGSPAVAGGAMFVRSDAHLSKIAEQQ
ncbi:MAG TPA: PQQ-binding-like beta-propeller repeat protein [Pirellulales bacterium]|nr:PQQ-binding-like beta-propeller repeat protein [Pirellulales bacterium]